MSIPKLLEMIYIKNYICTYTIDTDRQKIDLYIFLCILCSHIYNIWGKIKSAEKNTFNLPQIYLVPLQLGKISIN